MQGLLPLGKVSVPPPIVRGEPSLPSSSVRLLICEDINRGDGRIHGQGRFETGLREADRSGSTRDPHHPSRNRIDVPSGSEPFDG
jgi:hypothetical protein